MELELCLALPFNYFPSNIEGFNQNANAGYDPKKITMMRKDSFDDNFSKMREKRSFAEAFEDSTEEVESKITLSLLKWNDQPNDEEEDNDDDDHQGRKKRLLKTCDKDFEEDTNQIVGWPPIKTGRKKQFHFYQGGWIRNHRNNFVGGRKSLYVKVKMEGVAIGRKVKLRLYDSNQVLNQILVQMFAKYQNHGNNRTHYTILYQDKEGDWMLAGDIPWHTFMETVQRMEILRNEK